MKRCKIGSRLFREWRMEFEAIPATNRAEWERVLFAPRKYDQHAKNCKTCSKIKAQKEK